jgi:hypothetical protein
MFVQMATWPLVERSLYLERTDVGGSAADGTRESVAALVGGGIGEVGAASIAGLPTTARGSAFVRRSIATDRAARSCSPNRWTDSGNRSRHRC